MVAVSDLAFPFRDGFVVYDMGPKGFVQVSKWAPDQFVVEWCDGPDPTCPVHGLWRAKHGLALGEVVDAGERGTGKFNLYQNDLLSLGDVVNILINIWVGQPEGIVWRDMAPEMREFLELKDKKHGRMRLCE